MQKSKPEEPATQDSYLVLKNLVLDGLHTADLDTSKCYIRALIDDDTYCTHYGKGSPLKWNDAIYLPLK